MRKAIELGFCVCLLTIPALGQNAAAPKSSTTIQCRPLNASTAPIQPDEKMIRDHACKVVPVDTPAQSAPKQDSVPASISGAEVPNSVFIAPINGFETYLATGVAKKKNVPVPVTVENTPLPVSGNVNANITNTSIPISGTVAISGTPTVNLGNTGATPLVFRDADNAARSPFQRAFAIEISAADGTSKGVTFTVPTGKELVVQFVSAEASLVAGQNMQDYSFLTTANGIQAVHFVPGGALQPGDTSNTQVASQPLTFYADPGTVVTIVASRGQNAAVAANINLTLSGYLVNLP